MAAIMATGYVHRMLDANMDFRQFAWECARGFGALIMLRDDSTAKIPGRFEPDDHYVRRLIETSAELARLESLDEAGRAAEAEAKKQADIDLHEKMLRQEQEAAAQIDAMLARVANWTPPSEDHRELKEFMAEQLTSSRSNCDGEYHRKAIAKTKATSLQDTFDTLLANAKRSVSQSEVYASEERERTEKRNLWIAALRASVGNPD